jgi:NitT/TauT family transport system substrate-binding protein
MRYAVYAIAAALALPLTGFATVAHAQKPAAVPAAGAGAKQEVTVRFTWKLKGEYAPLFVALDKGYYAAEGLDVHLAEGSGAETVVKMVGLGTDKIAYGPATVVAEAINQGLPVKIVAIYQDAAPIGLVSFPDVPLKTPKDLEGKTLGLSIGETFANLLKPFAEINHVDLSKVKVIQMKSSARATQFMAHKLDVISLYLSNELPLFEKKAGVKFNVISIANFGMKVLGASFLVNDSYAKNHPETIRKLLRATAKGYRYAKENDKEATDIMEKYLTLKIDHGVLEQQVRATMDSTAEPAGKPLGWQSEAEWKSNLELLKNTGLIKEIKDVHAYYTNEYLR